MKENILEVLLYLFENHMKDNASVQTSSDNLFNELKLAGFNVDAIDSAFDWLEELSESTEVLTNFDHASNNCFRVLSVEEQYKIDKACWGFLLYLEQIGILDAATREIVIDRLVVFDKEQIDLPQIKWVTLLVLFNLPSAKEALNKMEYLVLEENFDTLH